MWGKPTQSDSSDVVAAGGETQRIIYYRYLDVGAQAADSAALVWRMRVRDGGRKTPDLDSLPTILDSLCIHVGLNDDTASIRTRSIVWAGLYTDSTQPQLIAVGTVGASTIIFSRLAASAVSVPDDSVRDFLLYLKFVPLPVLGDRFSFAVGDTDVAARGPAGREDSTSLFGPFAVALSDTSGKRNYLTSLPKRIDLRTAADTAAPGVPFAASAALLDTFGLMVPDPPDTMFATIDSPFGSLTGNVALADSAGIVVFDSLTYSFRNDSATITLRYPDADSASWPMVITGGAPTIPTVTHAGPWSIGWLPIDGTGVSLRFAEVVTAGSFLTERMESQPLPLGALPINVGQAVPRYVRITPDNALTIAGGFDIAFPTDGLSGYGALSSLYLLQRPDRDSIWTSPAASVIPAQPGSVAAHVDAFGEIGLGGTVDVAVPVDELTVTASSLPGEGIDIAWRLSASVGSQGFEVFRSDRSEGAYGVIASYRTIPVLEGLGTNPFSHSFRWLDNDSSLHPGSEYFYKIREVKQDGRIRDVGPVAARFIAGSVELPRMASSDAPFPNPFEKLVSIPLPYDLLGVPDVHLYDALGRVPEGIAWRVDGTAPGVLVLDGSALPSGAYLYQIRTAAVTLRGTLVKLER